MAARRTDVHRLQEVVRLHRMGLSGRKIARRLRMGRDTIGRVLEAFGRAGLLAGDAGDLPEAPALRAALEAAHPPRPAPQQTSSIERWRQAIEHQWKEKHAQPTAIHDWLRLRDPDYTGSLSAVKRFCLRLAREAGPSPEDVAIPVETAPGEVAQVDFVHAGRVYDPDRGVPRRAWIFVMTLGYSRHMFVDLVFDQKVDTWLRLHVRAFEALRGVPAVLVPDNLKSAVIRAAFGVDDELTLNRSYRELARHYGFQIDPTPPRSPQKKGKVERSGRYVKGSFWQTHTSVDIETDRRALRTWNTEVADKRIHGTTARRPGEVFETEERAALGPLPPEPFQMVIWKRATLHRDAHVQVDGAFYSAPWKLIGSRLEVRIAGPSVTLYLGDDHLWTHAKARRGQRRTVEAHLPEHRAPLRRRSRSFWLHKAAGLGEDCRRLAEAIFEADDVLLQLRKVQAVVTYLEDFPACRANAAARRALHYRCLTYGGLKNILTKGLDLEPLDDEGPKRDWASGSRYARDPAQLLLALKENEDADPE